MLHTRRIITIGAVALALAAPGTAVAQQDLRSPDARDAAAGARQDLRSPDARDAAAGPRTIDSYTPEPIVAEPVEGFDWGAAGVGAAGTLGLVLGTGGIGLLVVQLRRRERPAAAQR